MINVSSDHTSLTGRSIQLSYVAETFNRLALPKRRRAVSRV